MSQRNCPKGNRRKMNFQGGRLRLLREEKGWTQAGFATELQRAGWDIDRAVLVRLEAGKRTLTDFEIDFILKILGRKWSDLD